MKKIWLYWILISSISILILGCGQSGRLYLPDQTVSPEKITQQHKPT